MANRAIMATSAIRTTWRHGTRLANTLTIVVEVAPERQAYRGGAHCEADEAETGHPRGVERLAAGTGTGAGTGTAAGMDTAAGIGTTAAGTAGLGNGHLNRISAAPPRPATPRLPREDWWLGAPRDAFSRRSASAHLARASPATQQKGMRSVSRSVEPAVYRPSKTNALPTR